MQEEVEENHYPRWEARENELLTGVFYRYQGQGREQDPVRAISAGA